LERNLETKAVGGRDTFIEGGFGGAAFGFFFNLMGRITSFSPCAPYTPRSTITDPIGFARFLLSY